MRIALEFYKTKKLSYFGEKILFSVLNKTKIKTDFEIKTPYWLDVLSLI